MCVVVVCVYQRVMVCDICCLLYMCVHIICIVCICHICIIYMCARAHEQPALTAALLCRGLLGRPGWRDSELLRQCRGSEQCLWGLPCSWVQVPAHAWGHAEELAKVVRGRILQEQARLVWVERGSSRGGSGSSSEA